MLSILGEFVQFSAKKMAAFLKTNVTIHLWHELAAFLVKNANFSAKMFFFSCVAFDIMTVA
jgi:hypothetical protein